MIRKALNQVVCLSKGSAYIRLRVFAWVFLRIVAGCCLMFRHNLATPKTLIV